MQFRVDIDDGDGTTVYEITENSHDHAQSLAAQKAMRTYSDHGHTRFPYEKRKLTITVQAWDD
jgi:hypothetical protein